MSAPPLTTRVANRLRGVPHSLREANQASLLLAYARRNGWYDSAGRHRGPVDGAGEPLPWWTLPSIEWLGSVLSPTDKVFEFGCGHSTLWLARRVMSVTAVEHNEAWHKRISSDLPANATVRHQNNFGNGGVKSGDQTSPYVRELEGRDVNVVIVDGMARTQCAALASETIRDGLIVLDNVDTQTAAYDLLRSAGLRCIDFVGLAPGEPSPTCTSVFSRDISTWLDRGSPPPWPKVLDATWYWRFDTLRVPFEPENGVRS